MNGVVLGEGAITHLPGLLASHHGRVVLVTGASSFRASGASAAVEKSLSGRKVTRLQTPGPNPTLEDLELLTGELRHLETPGVVLAVGGGSVLDLAKLVAAVVTQHEPPRSVIESGLIEPAIPLIAVPTTAGSGSQRTHFAVVYVDGVKHSVAHESMRPIGVIVDPRLTHSLTPEVTAATGLDALAHAVESLWSVKSTNESQMMSEGALVAIWRNLPQAVREPTAAVRAEMAIASDEAGSAVDVARTTASHALSYTLTIRHGVPHGHAVALTLGPVLRFNSDCGPDDCSDLRGVDHVAKVVGRLVHLLGASDPDEAAHKLEVFIGDLGLAVKLNDLGIEGRDVLGTIVDTVNLERLANNPRRMNRADLLRIVAEVA